MQTELKPNLGSDNMQTNPRLIILQQYIYHPPYSTDYINIFHIRHNCLERSPCSVTGKHAWHCNCSAYAESIHRVFCGKPEQGMPRKAVECGAVDEVRNLEEIVRRLIELR